MRLLFASRLSLSSSLATADMLTRSLRQWRLRAAPQLQMKKGCKRNAFSHIHKVFPGIGFAFPYFNLLWQKFINIVAKQMTTSAFVGLNVCIDFTAVWSHCAAKQRELDVVTPRLHLHMSLVSIDRIMPLVSNARKYISSRKTGNITVPESNSQCVKTVISFFLTIQTHLTIKINKWIEKNSLPAITACSIS